MRGRFDHNYYRDKHMPLIARRMGAALNYYTVDEGLSGGLSDVPATYVGICNRMCGSPEAYHSAFDPHGEELTGDIQNFTDQTPEVQISEVVVDNSGQVLKQR